MTKHIKDSAYGAERLERARSQIENKFSDAGSVLEGALAIIGSELELLDQLNKIMGASAVENATHDLVATATTFNALPASLEARNARLGQLEQARRALRLHIEEMRSLLKYLLVFAMNLKIAGTEATAQAYDFSAFAQEMKSRLEQGEAELDDFDARLVDLDHQIKTARAFEEHLFDQAKKMLPTVPDRLTKDAVAIDMYNKRTVRLTADVSTLAQKIKLKVCNVLSALQAGDITRQRIEHVQTALSWLGETRTMQLKDGWTADARDRFERFVYGLLAAQLSDTVETFGDDAGRIVDAMAVMAADTEELLKAQLEFGGAPDSGSGLRSLETSVAQALELVTDMEKAGESADKIHKTTTAAVEDLVTCVDSVKNVKEDVQFMALNTTVRCSRLGDAGKPLEVIAIEVRLYAKKLEATSEATRASLHALRLAATASGNSDASHHGDARTKLEAAVACLREAANVIEHDLTNLMSRGQEAVSSLTDAKNKLNFESELVGVISEEAQALVVRAGDPVSDLEDIAEPLQVLLDRIAPIYTMAREREVHAMFALPSGAGRRRERDLAVA